MGKKKIIVVDDEPLIPILMKEIIEEDKELEIARIVANKHEFLSLVAQDSFAAGIIDISIDGREGGIELMDTIKLKGIDLPLIILSAHDEALYAYKCLQAGASGYINKRYICSDVIRCLKEVFEGRLFVSGEKGESIIKKYKELNGSTKTQSL
jgi:DNA-binding NarL/FixJ family response regulator